MSIKEKISEGFVFFDGAMGTILQERGLKAGELPEIWNEEKRDIILSVHKAYCLAGADIIKSNTFGANRLKLKKTNYTVEQLVTSGVDIAREAVSENGFVALDIGPTGKLLKPIGELDFEDAVDIFAEMVRAGSDADILLIETMSDLYETKAAVIAAKENSDKPIFVTLTFDEKGRLLTGGDIESAVALLEALGIDAIGFNCGLGPKGFMPLLERLIELTNLPIIVNPNAGLPVSVNGKTVYNVSPEEFAQTMAELSKLGGNILGGCCGTTPAHIKCMTDMLKNAMPTEHNTQKRTAVSSYGKTVVLGERPIIIGERINPTGKPKLKAALKSNDMGYIFREALSQCEAGADILDVNVGMPELDEPKVLSEAVMGIQAITDAPLQIDTSDTVAMERALRIYNGKPLLNSVNGKEESMSAVFPIAKKYGAAVVALTLDENGIPDTAEGRIAIAKKIIDKAAQYGIDKSDIIVDTLTMTVSTGANNAKVTADALSYIRNTMGVHTVLGVSNVSFGLPQRNKINSAFFTICMERGLSAGIINPKSEDMMNSFYSFCALKAIGGGCDSYISAMTGTEDSKPEAKSNTELTLDEAIVKGLAEYAGRIAAQMVKENEPLDIINNILVPALDKVGEGFEKGTLFLPQLLKSADSAKYAFDAIKEYMSAKGVSEEKKGKIILATVKGDIHDIGKNIVKVLLENYGFDVIDLGKDVDPQLILETAQRENVKLVGLSALMTTTVVNMEATIKLLRKHTDCTVMVGGAVMTEEYASQIDADFYSKDAMGSVRFAESFFEKL